MSWLYSAGILTIGIALHTFLKRWTTLALMVLFVMLNFTSSGGIFQPALQNGFFGALHAFWNGAGFVEGARSLLYFDSAGFAGHILTLVLWLVAGLLLLAAAAVAERHAAPAPAATRRRAWGRTPRTRRPRRRWAKPSRSDGAVRRSPCTRTAPAADCVACAVMAPGCPGHRPAAARDRSPREKPVRRGERPGV